MIKTIKNKKKKEDTMELLQTSKKFKKREANITNLFNDKIMEMKIKIQIILYTLYYQ